jgi:hypothetical protein
MQLQQAVKKRDVKRERRKTAAKKQVKNN